MGCFGLNLVQVKEIKNPNNQTVDVVNVLTYYRFLTEALIPIVKTEFQLLYVYHLVGPFLQRFQQERTRCMIEVKSALYCIDYFTFAIIL